MSEQIIENLNKTLTEEIELSTKYVGLWMKSQNENQALRNALKEIALIDNMPDGGDWEEIETARRIANEALSV